MTHRLLNPPEVRIGQATPVRATCKEVECINSEGVPDTLLVFRIEPGERVHEMKNGARATGDFEQLAASSLASWIETTFGLAIESRENFPY